MIYRIEITANAYKQLNAAPQHVAAKLLAWIDAVEATGLENVRRIRGFHDHPLKGKLKGKRAIRLSRQWRAVYDVKAAGQGRVKIEFAEVQEVHPHDY